MYQTIRNVTGAAVLILVAVVTWVMSRPPGDGEIVVSESSGDDMSYYLRDATLYGTNAEGRITYRLSAREVNQPADGGALQFGNLEVRYDPEADVAWRLVARTGVGGETPGILELSDGVRLENAAVGRGAPTVIETPTLTLDTEHSTARTEDRVRLAHGRTRFEATGLTADLARDRIDLHADVSALVLP